MTGDLPKPTKEGALIRRVRESIRPRLSVPAAAKRAGISDVTWGNVERGYKSGGRGKPPVPVRGSKQLIAHMAYEIGIKPGDLEEIDRADAAEVLREMQGPELDVTEIKVDRGTMLVGVPPTLPDEDREFVKQQAEELAAMLDRRRRESGK